MASPNEDRTFDQSLDFRKNYNDVRQQYNSGYEDTETKFSRKMALSPEEMLALKECNKESFYQRALPFAAVAGISTHYAVKVGYLSGGKYGSLWKVIGAGVLGIILGKFSYIRKCEEKLMRVPNSQIAEVLKRKRGLTSQELYAPLDQPITADKPSEMYGPPRVTDRNSETDMGSGSWEIDDDRNIKFPGFDESQRLSLDVDYVAPDSDLKSTAVYTSYDDLRKQNRDEYEMRRFGRKEPPANTGPGAQPYRRPTPPSNADIQTNQYGDKMY